MTTITPLEKNKKSSEVCIETIEAIDENNIMFICDAHTAKNLLRRNPKASVTKGNEIDDRYAVVYRKEDCNLLMAVRKK